MREGERGRERGGIGIMQSAFRRMRVSWPIHILAKDSSREGRVKGGSPSMTRGQKLPENFSWQGQLDRQQFKRATYNFLCEKETFPAAAETAVDTVKLSILVLNLPISPFN